jgi:apoptosis-inducing factor 3
VNRGVVVDAYLETMAPGIFAGGDIARPPDSLCGDSIRVEHWVVAERQGQTTALNMRGDREKFSAAPFFWSQDYDIPINYIGQAERWDEIAVEGSVASKYCLARLKRGGRTLVVASIFRDVQSLEAEVNLERDAAISAVRLVMLVLERRTARDQAIRSAAPKPETAARE